MFIKYFIFVCWTVGTSYLKYRVGLGQAYIFKEHYKIVLIYIQADGLCLQPVQPLLFTYCYCLLQLAYQRQPTQATSITTKQTD